MASDHQHVAILGLHALAGARGVGSVLLGQFGHGRIDLGVCGRVDRLLKIDLRRIDRFEFRHHLDGHVEGQVFLTGQHLFHVGRRRQVGLGGRAQVVVRQHLLAGFVQGLLDHFAHKRLAIQATNMGRRHLARTESLQLQLWRDLLDPCVKLLAQVRGGDGDAIEPAESLTRFFNDLYRHLSFRSRASRPPHDIAFRQK